MIPAAVAATGLALLAVLGLTGGLDEKPAQPVASAGKTIDQGRFKVTVRDVRIGTAATGFGTNRQRFVIARMRVVNAGKETASLGGSGLAAGIAARTKDGKWLKPDEVEGLSAGSRTSAVQPGLPVEASVMWRAGPADSPRQFTIGLRKWVYEQGFSNASFTWRVETKDDELAARLTLPVTATPPATGPGRGPGGTTPGTNPGGTAPGTGPRSGATAAPGSGTGPGTGTGPGSGTGTGTGPGTGTGTAPGTSPGTGTRP
ncbi:hypothetical protein ACQP1W_03485 [Spirillospora sp. CA-255316]